MDREQLLKQEIDKIVAYGKSKGSISEDDIMARLEHLNATAEDMEMVFNALQNENVKVEVPMKGSFSGTSAMKSSASWVAQRSAPMATSKTSAKFLF